MCRLGRLPEAKDPKKNLHACQDTLLTVCSGHLITSACRELGLDSPNSDWPSPPTREVCVADIATKVVSQCTVIPEAVLGQPLEESEDGVHSYARVLCHFAALASEFADAWGRGMVSAYFGVGRSSCSTSMPRGGQSMPLRH